MSTVRLGFYVALCAWFGSLCNSWTTNLIDGRVVAFSVNTALLLAVAGTVALMVRHDWRRGVLSRDTS